MELHDRIAAELADNKSLAALIWLIRQGREVEFTAGGRECFLSRSRAERYVSLGEGGVQQSFDTVEELVENAVVAGQPFLSAWADARIETIF